MTPPPGSLAWLVAHELRLNCRRFLDMFGRLPLAAVCAICLAGVIVVHLLAWPIAAWLIQQTSDAGSFDSAAGSAAVFSILAWMTAQGLLGMARTLQDRAGMDLLLASPLPMRRILAARLLSIAAGSLASVGVLLLPVADMAAMLGDPAWLALYPTLVSLALIGTCAGTAIAIGLFLHWEPLRARFIAQMCAAFIGGAFLLAAQVAAMLPPPLRAAAVNWMTHSPLTTALEPVVAGARGDVVALAALATLAVAALAATVVLLGDRFLRATLEAAGRTDAATARADRPAAMCIASSLRRTLHRKEWRLLLRDQGVFAQLTLQIIYTLPLAVVLLRGADSMPLATALAPTFVVIAAQIAASLAWITVSGEDAPELIAAAPVGRGEVELAKLSAIGLPVLMILALPLAGLALMFPYVALLSAGFATAAGVSTALLNLWHPMPGNRRGMLRRHSQSKVMALLEHLLALLWAVAVMLALIGSAWVTLPIALVALVLAFCRPAGRHGHVPGR
jgi:ABC-2 type transport system permease protein